MADLYPSYTALAASEVEGVDYERRSVSVTGATWASIAIHGGGIEPGSGEMARQVGAGLMNHYEFAGIKSSGNTDLHVTSTNFDEPTCQSMVANSQRTLSFHGFTGTTGVAETAVGGLDADLVARVTEALTTAGFAIRTAPSEIAGTDPNNVCNKNKISAGVQLEMSRAQREAFFPGGDLTRAMRDSGQRTPTFYAYAAAVQSAYDGCGIHSAGSRNVFRHSTIPAPSADVDLQVDFSTNALATGDSLYAFLMARYTGTADFYFARVQMAPGGAMTLTLRKRTTAGGEVQLASYTTGLAHTANTFYTVRLNVTGSTLSAKCWQTGQTEPAAWQLTATDTAITAVGSVGVRSLVPTANTTALPVIFRFNNFAETSSPQRFAVTRSVNGIAKAHTAGTDVRLAQPAIVAL